MRRRRSLGVTQRDEEWLPRIHALKAEHPFWGYRCIWAYWRFVEQMPVNKTRMLRLLREHPLLVTATQRLQAKRTPTGRTPKPTKPHERWGIEMTKVMVEGVGWVSIVLVLDWYSKKIIGDYAGMPCTARHGLEALEMAVKRQFPDGARGQGVSLMSDNGCQPTSLAFMRACTTLEIHQACTSYNHPKGNADTERGLRTLQEECLWLREWTCPCA